MKKLFYSLICFVTIFAIASCGNSEQEKLRQQQIEDSIAKAKADSIAKIQALEKAKADSIARAKADSLEKINNPHPDLKLFDLRGPVKSCKGIYIGHQCLKTALQYSPSGELSFVKIHDEGEISKIKIHRNNNKATKITYTVRYDEEYDEIYNCYIIFKTNDSGYIQNVISGNDFYGDVNTKIERDNNYLCIKEFHLITPDMINVVHNYKYLEFDKYGNWIKRSRSGGEYSKSMKLLNSYPTSTETRTITYYE